MNRILAKVSLREVIAFEGVRDRLVVTGCEKAINTIYWTLLAFAVPVALIEHLLLNYSPIGWLYVLCPLVYLPVALGWPARHRTFRFAVGLTGLSLVALSINCLYGWEAQPGIYLMTIPALIIYCVHGGRSMIIVTLLQMIPVIITSLLLNPNSPVTGVLIACATWMAVNLAACMLVHRVLTTVMLRNRELEHLSDQLLESQERLADNESSVQHIARVGIGRSRQAADNLAIHLGERAGSVEYDRLCTALNDVYEALVCGNAEACPYDHHCSQCPGPDSQSPPGRSGRGRLSVVEVS